MKIRPIIILSLCIFITGSILSYFISLKINNVGQDKNRSIYETESENIITQIKQVFVKELDSSSSVSVGITEIFNNNNGNLPLTSFQSIGREFFSRSLTERTVFLKRVRQVDIKYTEEKLSELYDYNVTIRYVFSDQTLEDSQDLWVAHNTYPLNLFIVGLDLYHEPLRRGLLDNMLKTRNSGALTIDKLFTGKNGLLTIKPILIDNTTQIDSAVMDVFTYDRLFGELLKEFSFIYPKNHKCIYINNNLVYSIGKCKSNIYGVSTNSIYDPSDIQVINSPYVYEKTILYYISLLSVLVFTTVLSVFICFLDIKRYQAIQEADIKTTFISEISHEIRTPMNGILGVSELLDENKKLDRETIEHINTIKSCGNTLLGIVNDVLDISKIESGMMKINKKECDIVNVVILCLKDLWKTFQVNTSKDIKLTLFTSKIPSTVFCDETRIKQILSNLVTNSFKFTQQGHINVKVDMLTSKKDNKTFLEFSVSDTGIGMNSKKIEYIFKPFTQINKGENNGGTGLGLTISRKLCNLMGGEISCQSTIGKGSEFKFLIEIDKYSIETHKQLETVYEYEKTKARSFYSTKTSNSSHSFRESPDNSSPKKYTVLVVDDVATNRLILKKMLQSIGLEVDTCNDGTESISMCDLNKYSLIFMDILMPKMNGTDATKKIRKSSIKNRNTPVVFVTADSSPGIEKRCIGSGGSGLIKKPITKNIILDSVYKHITTL